MNRVMEKGTFYFSGLSACRRKSRMQLFRPRKNGLSPVVRGERIVTDHGAATIDCQLPIRPTSPLPCIGLIESLLVELLRRVGQTGPPSHPDVHLGELEERPHAGRRSHEVGCSRARSLYPRYEQQGPWVLSSSQAVHQALSSALLEERGLPSLLGIWQTLPAKSRTA